MKIKTNIKTKIIYCYLSEDENIWFAKGLNGTTYRFDENEDHWYNNDNGYLVKQHRNSTLDEDELEETLNACKRVAAWNHNYWRHPKHPKILRNT